MTGAGRMMVATWVTGLLLGCLIGAAVADLPLRWPTELNDTAAMMGQLCEQQKFADARAVIQQRQAMATGYEQRACLERLLGKTYEREKAFDPAILHYRQVIEQYPNSRLQVSWAKRDLAITYMDKAHRAGPMEENMRLARQVLEDLVKTYPDFERIDGMWMKLAECNEHLDNDETALSQYLKEVELYPTMKYSPDCLMDAITIQEKLERWDNVIASGRRYLTLYPDNERAVEVQFRIGYSYLGKGDRARAAAELGAVVTLFPANRNRCAMALYQKALCHKALGQPADARATFEQVVQLYPEQYLASRAKAELEKMGVQ